METAPARRHQRRQNPFPGPGLVPATLHNPGALVPVAEGLSSTWPELTALTSHESWGSPARGWDLVLPCIPRMTPNHCFAGDQRSGLHGDAEAARHWHGGGCRGRFRLPKSWSFPSHHKPHPQEPCWEPWAHEALPNGTRARPGSVEISHKRSPWSPQELSPFAGSTRDSEHPAPTPPSLQPRLSQQGKKQFVFIRAPRPRRR